MVMTCTHDQRLNLGNIWNTYGIHMDSYGLLMATLFSNNPMWYTAMATMAMAWVTMSKLLDSPVWSFFAPLVFQWFPVPTVLPYHRPRTADATMATSTDPSCQLPKGEVRPPKLSQSNTHWSSTLHVCCMSMHFVAQWSHLRPSRP